MSFRGDNQVIPAAGGVCKPEEGDGVKGMGRGGMVATQQPPRETQEAVPRGGIAGQTPKRKPRTGRCVGGPEMDMPVKIFGNVAQIECTVDNCPSRHYVKTTKACEMKLPAWPPVSLCICVTEITSGQHRLRHGRAEASSFSLGCLLGVGTDTAPRVHGWVTHTLDFLLLVIVDPWYLTGPPELMTPCSGAHCY